jgi:predicted permease
MDVVLRDIRFAFRQLRKNPLFASIIVLTLALGIGANAAIFALLDQVLLRSLHVSEPEQLVVLDAPGPNSGSTHSHLDSAAPLSYPMFQDLSERSHGVFSGVLAYYYSTVDVSVRGETQEARGTLVSGGFFDVLGLRPALGRLFTDDDNKTPGAHPVVVLANAYWRKRFGSDGGVVGRTILVNGQPMVVVGVAPKDFNGLEVGRSEDVYVPLMMQRQIVPNIGDALPQRRVFWLSVLARLQRGTSLAQAKARINVVYHQILQDEAKTFETQSAGFRARFVAKTLSVLPGARGVSDLRSHSEVTLLVLMGMVALVLFIACANVANLLLARSSARRREIVLRLALGASRGRLVLQLVVESLVLSLLGGLAGLVVSSRITGLLLQVLPDGGGTLSSEPDFRIGLFALGVSILTGLAFGIGPALQSTKSDLFGTLRQEAGNLMGGIEHLRLRKALVVGQVALSLLLLMGAGLFARSLHNLRSLDPGFKPQNLLTFTVNPSLLGYDDQRGNALLRRIQDDLLAEPGVVSASMAGVGLMTDSDDSSTVIVEGYEPKELEDMNPNFNQVGTGFFRTLGIPLLQGREFGASDAAGSPRVALVNETFARYFFKDRNPVGRKFGLKRNGLLDTTIVGLVRDGKSASLKEPPRRFAYLPIAQVPQFAQVTFYVRSEGSVLPLESGIRRLVRGAEPALPVADMKTMSDQMGESLIVERMTTTLSAAFGLLATALAALGLYGVISYAVSRRTREIGIRMAIGAQRGTVVTLIMTEVGILTGLGVILGLPSGLGCSTALRSQLFGLAPGDPLTTLIATLFLVSTSLVAGYLPARRASRVDPMVALRHE